MNISEVIRLEGKGGAYSLLYSHDTGYTRHVVVVIDSEYYCLLNEVPVFNRGTHQKMAKLHGLDLSEMNCVTFREASYMTI